MLALIEQVRAEVAGQTGIALATEVKVWRAAELAWGAWCAVKQTSC